MRSRMVEQREGEDMGPIDWNYDFASHGWTANRGGMNPDMIRSRVDMLKQIAGEGEWLATTDGGWPRVGWHKVLAVRMYDGWPYWKPVPSFCVLGPLGPEWHSFCSLTGVESVRKPDNVT